MITLVVALAGSACARGADVGAYARGGSGAVTAIDAAVPLDAGSTALVGSDAGPPDVGPIDSGPPDAGPIDARICELEACNGLDDDCDGMIDESAGCPCDVRTLAGGTYLFCDAPSTWADARTLCEGVGYHFVEITTAAEDDAVYREIASRGWIDTWIGLTDAAAEGAWRWSSGDPVSYVHWNAGEPNDGAGGEDCGVIMTMTGRESEWDDRACTSLRPHVCDLD